MTDRRRAFSLVEVSIAAAVLGVAAIMLSATMATSNGQKHAARRMGLARSLVARQLELFQQRVYESDIPSPTTPPNPAPPASLASLRSGAKVVALNCDGTGELINYSTTTTSLDAGGPGFEIPTSSPFHVFCTQAYSGAMTAAELQHVNDERIDIRTYISAVDMDGYTLQYTSAGVATRTNLSATIKNLDLVMVQVVATDYPDPAAPRANTTQMLSMTRMYRVKQREDAGGLYPEGAW